MRVKYGGGTIDLKLAGAKLWAGGMLCLFVIATLYFLSNVHNPDDVPQQSNGFDTQPKGDVKKMLQSPKLKTGKRYDDELMDVAMAMDSAKTHYEDIIMKQRDMLANQVRPEDAHYNINVSLSDRISLDRKLFDSRPPICRTFHYDLDKLPRASVIVPFYNEALSMLLRTIHSVLNHSPESLLNEIILVDDASTRDYLKAPLDDYIKLLPKVRIMRNTRREGLIVSRLIGSRSSKGPVVIFLDAHTEANVGWLEPLLDNIQRHPASVVQPFVDGIDKDTIEYTAPPVLYKGAFSWDMGYRWLRVLDHDAMASKETGHPFYSPTLVGCAMAVDKEYFEHIGEFDEGLKVWGGENIELAFRVWQCGGRVTTVICSRVGHVFKNFPYKFDGDRETIVSKNLMRVTETWMDGFRKYYYATARVYDFKRAELDAEELSSLATRIQLRKRLQCKNFEWYMHNILPEVEIPPTDSVYYGELSNLRTHACWELTDDYYIGMNYVCYEHKIIPENYFRIDKRGILRFRDKCVRINPPAPALRVSECPQDDENIRDFGHWSMKNRGVTWGQLTVTHKTANGAFETFCVTQVTNVFVTEHNRKQMPQLSMCEENNEFQMWIWTYHFAWEQVPPRLHTINQIGAKDNFIQ